MFVRSIIKVVCVFTLIAVMVNPAGAQGIADKIFTFLQETHTLNDKKLRDFLIDELDQYLMMYPESRHAADASFMLADTYEERGMKHEALAMYCKTVFLYPDSALQRKCGEPARQIISRESEYRDKQEKLNAVFTAESAAGEADDRYYSYLNFLAGLDASRLHEWRLSEIRRFISCYPTDVRMDRLIQWMAESYMKMDKPLEASMQFSKLASVCPASSIVPYALYCRGRLLYEDLNKADDAAGELLLVVSAYPESEYAGESLFLLGEIKEKKLRDYEGAIAEYRKLVDTYPDFSKNVSALLAMSEIYLNRLKNYQAAIDANMEIIEKYRTSPQGVEALEKVADIYENKLKDYQKSAEYYARIAELYPASEKAPDMLLKAGSICDTRLNDYKRAIEYYQRIVDQYPSHKKANDAKSRISKARDKLE